GDSTYSATLRVIGDTRASHTVADRKAQFALSVTLYDLMNQMTSVVDRMNDMRGSLGDRETGLSAADSLLRALARGSAQVDTMRKKIVATKEGGMITGEERLRENLTDLYGNVVFYDGRPSQMEVDRTEAIGHELSDIAASFDTWSGKDLAALNTELAAKNLKPIVVITRSQWEVAKAGG